MTMQASLSVTESVPFGIVERMNSVGKRIRHLRASVLGMTQHELAEALERYVEGGITRGAVGNWERDQGIKTENLSIIARLTGVSMDWLANGTGPAPQAKSDLARQGTVVSTFDPDASEVDAPFEAEMPENIDPDGLPRISQKGIVEVDTRAGTGPGGELAVTHRRDGDDIQTLDAIKPEPWQFPAWFMQGVLRARPEHLLAIETQGDSMEPTIDPGAVVFIDTRHRIPSPDGVYAIRDHWGHIQIKRLESFGEERSRIRVVSDKDGRAVSMPLNEIAIVGKVVASWRRL